MILRITSQISWQFTERNKLGAFVWPKCPHSSHSFHRNPTGTLCSKSGRSAVQVRIQSRYPANMDISAGLRPADLWNISFGTPPFRDPIKNIQNLLKLGYLKASKPIPTVQIRVLCITMYLYDSISISYSYWWCFFGHRFWRQLIPFMSYPYQLTFPYNLTK